MENINTYVETFLDDYSVLHAVVLDMLISQRSMEKSKLLKYIKLALLNLLIDSSSQEKPVDADVLRYCQHMLERSYSVIGTENESQVDPLEIFTDIEFNDVISMINKKISFLDFEIVNVNDMDMPDVKIYIFVNKKDNGSIKFTTNMTENRIVAVKAIIDRIFNDKFVNAAAMTYLVKPMRLIEILREEHGMSSTEAEEFLQSLEVSIWLERYHDTYTLSLRGLSELRQFLIEKYGLVKDGGTISTCFGCQNLITRGVCCSDSHCFIRMHKNCKNLVKMSRESEQCPNDLCSKTFADYQTF